MFIRRNLIHYYIFNSQIHTNTSMFSSLLSQASCQALEKSSKMQVEPQQRGLVQSLVASRQIAAASVASGDSCEFGSLHYFALCGLGGKKIIKNLIDQEGGQYLFEAFT